MKSASVIIKETAKSLMLTPHYPGAATRRARGLRTLHNLGAEGESCNACWVCSREPAPRDKTNNSSSKDNLDIIHQSIKCAHRSTLVLLLFFPLPPRLHFHPFIFSLSCYRHSQLCSVHRAISFSPFRKMGLSKNYSGGLWSAPRLQPNDFNEQFHRV